MPELAIADHSIGAEGHTKHGIEKKHVALRYILGKLYARSARSLRNNSNVRSKRRRTLE